MRWHQNSCHTLLILPCSIPVFSFSPVVTDLFMETSWDVQHNWLEIVCCPAVIVSSAVWWALNCYMCEHSCFEHIYEHFGILSITPIFCFSMKSLYFKHHFSHSIYVSAFGTIAQCICAFWTQQVLSSCDTILLTLESQIIAPGTPC